MDVNLYIDRYNAVMQQLINDRIQEITQEILLLNQEKAGLSERQKDIEVKLHQLVGAAYELQKLIDSDIDTKG